jgi:predicted RecA/RadA family phage recombinase
MAKAKYWQSGESLDYKNSTGATIEANTVVVFGTKIGIVGCDIPAGEVGSLHVKGVFAFPISSEAITAGAAVYWDATNSVITATSTNNTLAGYAVDAVAATDTEILVNINA